METQKKEEGITLVALILTVILLVILSAVGISVIYNSRIIEYAIKGAQDYGLEGINENKVIGGTENLIESIANNKRGGVSSVEPEENPNPEPEEKHKITYYTYNKVEKIEKVEGEIILPNIENITVDGETYTPRGWSTNTEANAEVIASGTKINVDSDVTYYASYATNSIATFYYNSNEESEKITPKTETSTGIRYINYEGIRIESKLNIPVEVTESVGKYNSSYVGVANKVGTMVTTTPMTGETYYTVYSSQVNIYYPKNTSEVTNVIRYRNEYFTDETTMVARIGTSNISTTNFIFKSDIDEYSLYGFATKSNTTTRKYSTISVLSNSAAITVYAIMYKNTSTWEATVYYNSNPIIGEFTKDSTKVSGTDSSYYYCASDSLVKNKSQSGTVAVPTVVKTSKGRFGIPYYGVTKNLDYTENSGISSSGTYYACYSKTCTVAVQRNLAAGEEITAYVNEKFAKVSGVLKMKSALEVQRGEAKYITRNRINSWYVSGGSGYYKGALHICYSTTPSAKMWDNVLTALSEVSYFSFVSAGGSSSTSYLAWTDESGQVKNRVNEEAGNLWASNYSVSSYSE